jgi:hypothetical protein
MIQQYLPLAMNILSALGALCLFATIVAKMTPSPKDDEVVGKVYGYLLKLIQFLPTLGVNPQTQKIQEALEEAKKN